MLGKIVAYWKIVWVALDDAMVVVMVAQCNDMLIGSDGWLGSNFLFWGWEWGFEKDEFPFIFIFIYYIW